MLNKIKEYDKQYYMNTFGERNNLMFAEGHGIELVNYDGDVYKDFFAGIAVSAIGHSHPTLVQALQNQAAKLLHTSSLYYIESQAKLAKKLCDKTCFDKSFFASTGAEANEGAIKLARKYFYNQNVDKFEIICLNQSFHGRTITTATATGQEKYKKPYAPLTPGFRHIDANDIDALNDTINDKTAAIMIEVIQGESGVRPLSNEFVSYIRQKCDECGILLIVDEVQTGIGRTGKFFAYEHYGIEPDIVTSAKALGGGVPISAILAKDFVASAFVPGDHGTTFGGNPFCTSAALATLDIIDNENLVENSAEVGAYFKESLINAIGSECVEIRGKGLMIGIEFKKAIGKSVCASMATQKYLVGSVGDSILRIVPPLIINKSDVDEFVSVLSSVVREEC